MSQAAEDKLKGMLRAAGLPMKGSYRRNEVMTILSISKRTFWRLLTRCERDEEGLLVYPDCLDSFSIRRERRVSYMELIDFLARNNSYTRANAVDPKQMRLFEGA